MHELLQVHLTEEETSGGLQIIPNEKSVTVPNAPVLDVTFTQFRAKVTGAVSCLGNLTFLYTINFLKFQNGLQFVMSSISALEQNPDTVVLAFFMENLFVYAVFHFLHVHVHISVYLCLSTCLSVNK